MGDEDEGLLARWGDGDEEAFGLLLARHHARLLGLCLAWGLDRTSADEAVHDIFMKVHCGRALFEGRARFSTWLHRIAVNHCREFHRARSRRREEPLDARDVWVERGPSLEAAALARDALDRAWRDLTPEDRALLNLREMQGLRYAEIAQVMGWSLDNVKIRLFRARQALIAAVRNISSSGGI